MHSGSAWFKCTLTSRNIYQFILVIVAERFLYTRWNKLCIWKSCLRNLHLW